MLVLMRSLLWDTAATTPPPDTAGDNAEPSYAGAGLASNGLRDMKEKLLMGGMI